MFAKIKTIFMDRNTLFYNLFDWQPFKMGSSILLACTFNNTDNYKTVYIQKRKSVQKQNSPRSDCSLKCKLLLKVQSDQGLYALFNSSNNNANPPPPPPPPTTHQWGGDVDFGVNPISVKISSFIIISWRIGTKFALITPRHKEN